MSKIMPLLPLTLPNAECWSKAFSGTLFLHGVDNIQEFNSRNVNSGEETFAVVVRSWQCPFVYRSVFNM